MEVSRVVVKKPTVSHQRNTGKVKGCARLVWEGFFAKSRIVIKLNVKIPPD